MKEDGNTIGVSYVDQPSDATTVHQFVWPNDALLLIGSTLILLANQNWDI
jgi:hypothetical protein